MALGFTAPSNAEFRNRVQYDARAGRLFKVDREQDRDGNWISNKVESRFPFKAIMDLENIEVGYIKFATGSVDFQMVKIGEPKPQRPTEMIDGKNAYKEGLRVLMYSKALGGVRELSHTAACVLGAIDKVHTEYMAQRAQNVGLVPVVEWQDTIAIVTGQGAKKSTNYAPLLQIVQWVQRPADLSGQTSTAAAPSAAAPQTTQPAPRQSAHVPPPPPPPAAKPVAAELDDDIEF